MDWSLSSHPRLKTTGIVLAVLLILLIVAFSFIDEPLRSYAERRANQALQGYHVTIGSLDFHPLGLSVDLENVVLVQEKHPEQPLADIARWTASIHWRELFTGNVVSDHQIERPVVHFTRTQAAVEARDKRDLKERGWQQAVLELYPLEINALEISDGDVTYSDSPDSKPLRLQALQFHAENIRNIESDDHVYPSNIKLDVRVFDAGRLTVVGKADFLAEPHLGVNADVTLAHVVLKDLLPLAGRVNLQVRDGILDAKGRVEYSPTVQQVELQELTVDGLRADYVQAGGSTEKAKQAAQTTKKQAAKAAAARDKAGQAEPKLTVRVARGTVTNSEIGFVNKDTEPGYRVFLAQLEMTIQDFSNRFDKGTGKIDLMGRFMGNGKLTANGVFRPQKPLPDFDVKIKITNTALKSMNNLLRAHAGADVKAGTFAFFSEMTVQRGKVEGYVKPFFKNIDVYDPAQDKDKGFFKQVYEGMVDGIVTLFENEPREAVATETEVTGPLSDPRANTWHILVNLLKNAFIKAIVPGFKQSIHA
ncbi:MAG: uncharacterized protein K0S45_798 [Nitrospira sp.]|jgi:uncharacterized protein involved in outer membrane biogenesis|nr:uncharacterized protein [Nitrospira sp.]